jgi:SSS family solute:Na+ symporter
VVIGGYLFYWGMIYKGKDDIWDYMAITGAIYFTGAFALLLFGLYTKWASRAGAYASLIAGTSAVVGLGPVMEKINAALAGWGAAFELTSERAGLGAVALAVIAMVVFSLIFPDESGSTDWMDTDEDEEEDD